MNGLIRLADDIPLESLPTRSALLASYSAEALMTNVIRERQEDKVFRELLKMCHGLEDRLLDGSDEDVTNIADLVSQ